MKFIKCNAMTRIMSNNKETMSLTMDHMKRSSYLRRFTVTALITLLMIIMGSTTASAAKYNGTENFVAKSRSTYSNGQFVTASNAGNGYALAIADLSDNENITNAKTIALDFDVRVNTGMRCLMHDSYWHLVFYLKICHHVQGHLNFLLRYLSGLLRFCILDVGYDIHSELIFHEGCRICVQIHFLTCGCPVVQ